MHELRIRLIERLCRLPEAQLASVDEFLATLQDPTLAPATPQGRPEAPSGTPASHKDWPHSPVHRLSQHGTFFVTAGTHDKQHFFQGQEPLTLLEEQLLKLAKHYAVQLEAWAVFSNHYHFVGHTSGAKDQITTLLAHLHTSSAAAINRRAGTPGRAVWFNFWDTQLTFEKSYLARLNYVHQNAVKHGLVKVANQYPWCSAAWFERSATRAQVKTVYSFKTDKVKVDDDYEPL